jgi:Uma2 family endonuclease
MTTAVGNRPMTADEFLELPDNGRDRFLIRGQLWETGVTYRNVYHSSVMVQLGYLLTEWLHSQEQISAKVVGGDAGFRLRPDPGTIVGIDVAIVSRNQAYYRHKNRVVFDGPPLLAVEILSPSDRQREIEAKVDEYLDVRVPLVWIVDPHFRTVTVHCAGAKPRMFASDDELSAEPVLPGLQIPVSRIFETM